MSFINNVINGLKNNAPKILFWTAVGTGAAGFAITVKNAPKAKAKFDEYKEKVAELEAQAKPGEKLPKEVVRPIRNEMIKEIAKEMALPVGLEAASFFCFWGANKINVTRNQKLTRENAGLSIVAAGATKKLAEYRKRTAERFGEEVDKELFYDIREEAVSETVTDPKTGKEKTVTTKKKVAHDATSQYSEFFQAGTSDLFTKDPWDNYNAIISALQSATCIFDSQGHLFLNDMRKLLGMKPVVEGYVVGWFKDPTNLTLHNKIEIGLEKDHILREINQRFLDGLEAVALLDFNVDGPILELIANSGRLERC